MDLTCLVFGSVQFSTTVQVFCAPKSNKLGNQIVLMQKPNLNIHFGNFLIYSFPLWGCLEQNDFQCVFTE